MQLAGVNHRECWEVGDKEIKEIGKGKGEEVK